jgi:hypothetical protein
MNLILAQRLAALTTTILVIVWSIQAWNGIGFRVMFAPGEEPHNR